MAIKKPFGYGSLSIIFLLSGFLINYKFGNGFIVTHYLFNIIGLDKYSNGTDGFNYPFLASIPFWLATVLVSKRHINDFGAVVSKMIGEFLLAISMIVTIHFIILSIWIKF
ncbi:hypothetical protein [Bacillus sp. FJAT-28004]|uniref:hypothetical protein n=1 Tax=Bacillus sp. FJAT-28004 TaxID=1679165 RepID=UPI0006B568A1|nr:hypothetical protein [Bacillus sp. FJAT-28004]